MIGCFFGVLNMTHGSGVQTLPFQQVEKKQPFSADLDSLLWSKDYYTIGEIQVEEIEVSNSLLEEFKKQTLDAKKKGLGDVIIISDSLIALGKKIWAIVEAGKPVYTSTYMDAISVLPKFSDSDLASDIVFGQMENWSAPKMKSYKVSYKNLFGMTVVGFDYTVIFQHGGTFEGKGSYLTGVSVRASNVTVSWGYTFDAHTKLVNISNRGSLESPLAGATMQIDYTVSTALRVISASESFHVTGDGEVLKY